MKQYILYCVLVVIILFHKYLICSRRWFEKNWTLDDCIDYALENNIELKLEKLYLEESTMSLSDSKWVFVPNLSANTSYNLSMGRVLDETIMNL